MGRLEQKLKLNNLKLTMPRKVIYGILNNSPKALSAKDVFDKMFNSSDFKADQASIYRNLNLFSEIGLVHKFDSGKYSICQHDEKESHQHMHIIGNCTSCGKTYEVDNHPEGLCTVSRKIKTYLKDFDSISGMTLQGKCIECKL